MYNKFTWMALMLFAKSSFLCAENQQEIRPNIIVIYTDDQGVGDVSALNAEALRYLENH